MCFFNSMTQEAAKVARRYGKQMDVIEAARRILAEQEQWERAQQEKDPSHKSDTQPGNTIRKSGFVS